MVVAGRAAAMAFDHSSRGDDAVHVKAPRCSRRRRFLDSCHTSSHIGPGETAARFRSCLGRTNSRYCSQRRR